MCRFPCSWVLVAVALCGLPGCNTAQQAPNAPVRGALATAPSMGVALAPGLPSPTKTAPAVARIVFVGKKHACACTQKAIAASSKALEARLGKTPAIPIERLEIDVDPDGVRKYQELQPMMALPALYFLDGKGQLVQMLQGEVSDAQLSGLLR